MFSISIIIAFWQQQGVFPEKYFALNGLQIEIERWNMSVEAILTRDLDIRFIDARAIMNEAKISLGIIGYYDKADEEKLVQTAKKIFDEQSDDVREAMQRLKAQLDSIKSAKLGQTRSSHSLHGSDDSSSSALNCSDDLSLASPKPSKLRRRLTGWNVVKFN